MELNLCCFPDDTFHASGLTGLNTGVLKLDALTQFYAVLSHGLFVWMIHHVPLMLLDPGLMECLVCPL